MFPCWWERSTERVRSQEPHPWAARALHLTCWSLVAHSSASAGSNCMMLLCRCPSGQPSSRLCLSLSLPSSASALHGFKCPAPWELHLPFKPLLRNADSKISTVCPQAPTLTQPQAPPPPLSSTCVLSKRSLPVKVLQPLYTLRPNLTHYQPSCLMRSKTSTPTWIALSLESMLPLHTMLLRSEEVPIVTLFSTRIIKSLISLQLFTFKSAWESITLR